MSSVIAQADIELITAYFTINIISLFCNLSVIILFSDPLIIIILKSGFYIDLQPAAKIYCVRLYALRFIYFQKALFSNSSARAG